MFSSASVLYFECYDQYRQLQAFLSWILTSFISELIVKSVGEGWIIMNVFTAQNMPLPIWLDNFVRIITIIANKPDDVISKYKLYIFTYPFMSLVDTNHHFFKIYQLNLMHLSVCFKIWFWIFLKSTTTFDLTISSWFSLAMNLFRKLFD